MLLSHFPELGDMSVLDLGGTAQSWNLAPVTPRQLTLLNLYPSEQEAQYDGVSLFFGDACNPPEELASQRFDLVYSNSLIEHVGGHEQRKSMARTVHSLGSHYWIQTPYRYFPIEPHWMFPGFQFLPVPARSFISKNWPFGWSYCRRSDAYEAVIEEVMQIELIGATELHHYFPGSIVRERLFGLTKSLIAVG